MSSKTLKKTSMHGGEYANCQRFCIHTQFFFSLIFTAKKKEGKRKKKWRRRRREKV